MTSALSELVERLSWVLPPIDEIEVEFLNVWELERSGESYWLPFPYDMLKKESVAPMIQLHDFGYVPLSTVYAGLSSVVECLSDKSLVHLPSTTTGLSYSPEEEFSFFMALTELFERPLPFPSNFYPRERLDKRILMIKYFVHEIPTVTLEIDERGFTSSSSFSHKNAIYRAATEFYFQHGERSKEIQQICRRFYPKKLYEDPSSYGRFLQKRIGHEKPYELIVKYPTGAIKVLPKSSVLGDYMIRTIEDRLDPGMLG